MSLLEKIRARARLQSPKKPELASFDLSVQSVEDTFPGLSRASAISVQQAIAKVARALSTWEWDDITTGTVSIVARAFLRGEVKQREIQGFMMREMEATTSLSLLDAACEAYFDGWERGSPRTSWLARLIPGKSQYLSDRWNRLFLALPELLDVELGSKRTAQRILQQADAFGWLRGCGIVSPHSGQLMRQVHIDWLAAMPAVRTAEQVDRIFAWIRPEGHPPISAELAAGAVDKLLEPWRDGMPEATFRQWLLDKLLSEYGDPRNAKREFWSLTSDASRQVLRRWLVGQSMDALLRVITDATDSSMWSARHHFWKGLHERGIVAEAWIVLSPGAMKIADDLYAETGNEIYKMAGRQIAKSRKDICLLVMRVGRFIVVEGSHDYRVHLFDASNPRAPPLYKDRYDAEAITFPADDPMARRHDPQGNWMRWVQERISR